MTSISNECFANKFLKEYTKNPKYYDTITEISWPKNKNGETDRNKKPLIENKFKMLSLDDICKDCSIFDKDNLPSTTDALWYNLTDEDNLILYFIEFKWHNLDNQKNQQMMEDTFLKLERGTKITPDMKDKFKKLYQSYSDEDVSFKLRLKPFESLFIVLPTLFEDYCNKKNHDYIDLHDFLKDCEIKVYSFVSTYTKPKEEEADEKNNTRMKIVSSKSKKGKRNKHKKHMEYSRTIGPKGSIGATIRKQYKRLEISPLIDFADIFPKSSFDTFLEDENLLTKKI